MDISTRILSVVERAGHTPDNLVEGLQILSRFLSSEGDCDDIKTLDCALDYMELVTCVYDYYTAEDLIADIRHDKGNATNPKGKIVGVKPWNAFVAKYKLPWRIFNEWGEDLPEHVPLSQQYSAENIRSGGLI